ncbi:nucleoside-diphosphate kinase [Sulfidibacter corallicola]|uniref:Nucleoside diphosphate kinase n=1 Tax=Sulfidibacter corallicola TaxID=2818388 RepID=A0A8A4TTQ2_SULCO|nr:nucleoside-diphosphate kinase [Sulfidibacter corallicola]QTD49915.1 nucleoside-diphosphate kinase [Sulfidibacter corallicola]
MSLQRTFAVIKPDAVAAGNTGNILAEIEAAGFSIAAMKKMHLTKSQAEGFYYVHKERPFFGDLVNFMTEGPIVALILEKENAIAEWRKLMGATNPEQAEEGTLRKKYGANIERNATHGSDAEETAAFETRYFFNAMETV